MLTIYKGDDASNIYDAISNLRGATESAQDANVAYTQNERLSMHAYAHAEQQRTRHRQQITIHKPIMQS